MDTKTSSSSSSSKRRSTIHGHSQSLRFRGLGAALAVGAGVWLAAVTTGLAQAEAVPQASAEAVTYADLDLSTTDGARALLKRIDLAAKRACGVEPSHSPLDPRAPAYFRDCVDVSVDQAVARVGSPMLASIHNDIKTTTSVTLAAR